MSDPLLPPDAFETAWRTRFERFARTYTDEALISGWSSEGLRRRLALFELILSTLSLRESSSVLDLGCGAGTYVRRLVRLGHRVVGLDYSLPSLKRARAADLAGKGRYVAGDAYALPVVTASMDLVVSIGVLQALARPRAAIAEMARVLRPGGFLVVEFLNARCLPGRVRRALHRFRGLPERVRTYQPECARGWVRDYGLQLVAEVPLYLPPRRLPRLAVLLDSRPVAWVLRALPGATTLVAHSILLVARRNGTHSSVWLRNS